MARVKGKVIVGAPKTDAGVRDVTIPPHLIEPIAEHLNQFTGPDDEALLFPAAHGGHLAPSTLYGRAATDSRSGHGFHEARRRAGLPEMRWQDLRHTGAVMTARAGAALKELMERFGWATHHAALIYQHAASERDAIIATKLSLLATSGFDDGKKKKKNKPKKKAKGKKSIQTHECCSAQLAS